MDQTIESSDIEEDIDDDIHETEKKPVEETSTVFKHTLFYGVDDCEHWPEEKKIRLKQKYRGHILEMARVYGIPTRGEGLIYRWPEEEITCPSFPIPEHWPRLCGIDMHHTYTGTFSAVFIAFDPDSGDGTGNVEKMNGYVYDVYKASKHEDAVYISALRDRGCSRIAVAPPHDMFMKDKAGSVVRDLWHEKGVNILPMASHIIGSDGSKVMSTLAKIARCSDGFLAGKLKILDKPSTLPLRAEMKKYVEENGQPKKGQDDHAIDAMHNAYAMANHASMGAGGGGGRFDIDSYGETDPITEIMEMMPWQTFLTSEIFTKNSRTFAAFTRSAGKSFTTSLSPQEEICLNELVALGASQPSTMAQHRMQ